MKKRNGESEPKLVIFDCDGTLVDSQHVIIRAMRAAFAGLGLEAPGDHEVRSIIGLSLEEAVGALAPAGETALYASLCEAYKEAFVAHRQLPDFHEPLFEGAREILQVLAGRDDVILGVATGKSRRGVDVLFEREGLADYFYTIQTADDAPSKPHPGMIERAMSATGIAQDRVLMIGDTSFDMEMAVNAGVGAIGVSWGYHDDQILAEAGAHRLIHRFEELAGLVQALPCRPIAQGD